MTLGTLNFVDLAPAGVVTLTDVALLLNPLDDVAVARTNLQMGTVVELADMSRVTIGRLIPTGHKFSIRAIPVQAPLRRYGQIIGFATADIAPGDHVHSHNLKVHDFERMYDFGVDVTPVDMVVESQRRTFMGYKRPSGKVGTRNYLAVLSTVNCSAHTSKAIAHHFGPGQLAAFPNVDGVIPLTHGWGCAMRTGGENYTLLQRALAGMANHANIVGYIVVGLGCETNNIEELVDNYHLEQYGARPPRMTVQDMGGIRKTIDAGVRAINELLPIANASVRTAQPISELSLALQCGGSDGWSGITANPVLGRVSDEIVRNGGTVVLTETPEIYGAEHLLTRRAASPDVGQKLVALIRWWEAYTARMNVEIDNNPSHGNKIGGLTTIFEKSLGAVAKGGSTPLIDVIGYAEPLTKRGLIFMDGPGYDPVGATGQVASGCNMLAFTTGRGSVFGFKPTPCVKLATNSTTYNRMVEDMDVNCGAVLEGVSIDAIAAQTLDLIIAVASGKASKSEELGVGEDEFQPWNLGGTV